MQRNKCKIQVVADNTREQQTTDNLHVTTITLEQTTKYPPLEQVTAPTVITEQAAFYLNRASQTLRKWACLESGPIRPIRINGRLAWKVDEIKALVGTA